MKAATKRILRKFQDLNHDKMNKIVDIISKNNNNKSKLYIKFDMIRSFLKYGTGYTDYFRGNFINIKHEEKKTFVTAKSFYKIIHYLNNYNYIGIFTNKLIFDKFFKEYLKRDYLNLKIATFEEYEAFLNNHKTVFAKDPLGECGHGIKKIQVESITDRKALYDELINNKQFLLEEEIVQCEQANEINPYVVNSFRVITLVKDGKSYIVGNALRVNQDKSEVIGCTNDLYFSFGEDGKINSNVIDDYGQVYDTHPLTGKKFSEIKIDQIAESFEMCKKAALEVPEVRYVGWDVAFSTKGPVLVEGNEYPGYGIVQFYKLKNKTTGHLKDIQDVIGDEVKNIKL